VPRSIWNGTVTFGTVVVPIKVHSAVHSETVHFHEVHAADGARIQHRRICPREDVEVAASDVVKGFEVAEDEYVVLTKDEVDAAAGERNRLVELEDFVDASAIDPVFYDKTYHLGVRDADDAYRLLHDALERTGRAGIGRWVFHNREYLVAVRPLDGVLAMHTMRFAAEVVAPQDVEVAEPGRPPTEQEVDMAAALVESLHADFAPEDFEDTYRRRVLDYLEAKRDGEAPEPEPEPEREASDDLAAALEASLAGARKGKR
jgi:DNA end-binding protein Ku